jgi:HK97 family phage major capsid protein
MPKESEILREQRATELAAGRAIFEAAAADDGRDLTDEEADQVEAHTEKAQELEQSAVEADAKEQRRLQLRANLDAEAEKDNAIPAPGILVDPSPSGSSSRSTVPATAIDHSDRDRAGFSSFGEFLFMVRDAARSAGVDVQLERRLQATAPTGLGTVVDSEMGFIIPKEFSSRILEHMHSVGTILGLPYMNIGLSGNTYEVPYINETSRADGSRWAGVQGYWVGENTAPTATDPEVGVAELKLKKAGCLGYVTSEQLEDAPATGDILERLFAQELVFKVEDGIVRGDGNKKPLGILNAPCAVSVAIETNQTAATLWGPNVVKMWARRNPLGARTNVWLVNQDVEPYMWSLTLEGRWGSAATAVDGVPLYHPAGSITNQGEFGILMGRPVIPCEYCSTLGTVGDIILFDPSQYIVARKRGAGSGVRADSSIHVRFTQDEKTFRVFYRVDGHPWWAAAMTPYQGTNTVSPIVTLAVRS